MSYNDFDFHEEEIAYGYGKSFDVSNVPDGYRIAVCFDKRMNKLLIDSRSSRHIKKNGRIMCAWYKGLIEGGYSFDDEELISLWNILGEVAINDDDEIEEDFLGFKAGTNREIIWKWFDERYSGGVVSLMRDAAKVMFDGK